MTPPPRTEGESAFRAQDCSCPIRPTVELQAPTRSRETPRKLNRMHRQPETNRRRRRRRRRRVRTHKTHTNKRVYAQSSRHDHTCTGDLARSRTCSSPRRRTATTRMRRASGAPNIQPDAWKRRGGENQEDEPREKTLSAGSKDARKPEDGAWSLGSASVKGVGEFGTEVSARLIRDTAQCGAASQHRRRPPTPHGARSDPEETRASSSAADRSRASRTRAPPVLNRR